MGYGSEAKPDFGVGDYVEVLFDPLGWHCMDAGTITKLDLVWNYAGTRKEYCYTVQDCNLNVETFRPAQLKLVDRKTQVIADCVCTSRDLFAFGCKCDYSKRTK